MATPGIRRAWRTVILPNPAAGQDWALTPGGQRWWRLVSFTAVFATSAAVANRAHTFTADRGGNVWYRAVSVAFQTAGQTVFHVGHTNGAREGGGTDNFNIPLPVGGLLLAPGDRFRVVTTAIDAADAWTSLAFRVEEAPSGLEYEGDQLATPPEST